MSNDRNTTTWRRIERTHRDAPGAVVVQPAGKGTGGTGKKK